jgi:ribA/ribD-fused uncharacterized protein
MVNASLIDYGDGEPILEFKDEYEFLSNFCYSLITYNGYQWRTVEHAYQWSKDPTDDNARFFNKLPTAGYAKRAGHRSDKPADWNMIRESIMLTLLRLKFEIPELREKLIATGNRWLEEGNTWGDTFWGVCPPGSGIGKNKLGKLLMAVRDEVR